MDYEPISLALKFGFLAILYLFLFWRVYSRGGQYYVEDMNSTNGTLLNGGAVSGTAELMERDLIAIGDTSFRVEIGT